MRRTHKYLIDRGVELLKFCFTVGLVCFLLTKAPDQASQVVSLAAAFILGSSGGKITLGL